MPGPLQPDHQLGHLDVGQRIHIHGGDGVDRRIEPFEPFDRLCNHARNLSNVRFLRNL